MLHCDLSACGFVLNERLGFVPCYIILIILCLNLLYLDLCCGVSYRYFVLIVLFLFLDQINGVVIIVLPLDIF